ncbi:hypothetical protein Pcinc_035368 [Petrolisthes cinctipes]|uniref:Uncharacterized protein n=1 Tax=Petrolisthes cinctipes TaxID=88211 RepID=A0AAE1BWQ8_PETCI|nr:hypothetical protein Pcinc_035368 [Petrolisthes cinctipes]
MTALHLPTAPNVPQEIEVRKYDGRFSEYRENSEHILSVSISWVTADRLQASAHPLFVPLQLPHPIALPPTPSLCPPPKVPRIVVPKSVVPGF